MDFETGATPAELLAADGTLTASTEETPFYNPAMTTPHSLLHELPPRPPSPYKSMQHNTHRTSPDKCSVASSFFRGRRNLYLGAAAAAFTGAGSAASTRSMPSPFSGCGDDFVYQPTQRGDSAVIHVDAKTHDSVMQQYLVYEAPRERLVEYEENERSALLAGEEVAFTSIVIRVLQARAELLAGDEAAEIVVAAALQRAEARREMLQVIEVQVSTRLREQRLGEMLEVQFRALLPAHAAGCRRIEADEREDLRRLFLWHKDHRPLGPGCFIKGPEEDYRLRYASRGTSAATARSPGGRSLVMRGQCSGLSSASSSRAYAAQLRQQKAASATPNGALGELVLFDQFGGRASGTMSSTQDGTLGPGEEAVFAEEGRLRLLAEKTRRHDELRERRRFTDLAEDQADARQYVLAEEALCWMHLTCAAVDDLYTAKEATRVRKMTEASEAGARAELEAQRSALKEQLRREHGFPTNAQEEEAEKDKVGEEACREAPLDGAAAAVAKSVAQTPDPGQYSRKKAEAVQASSARTNSVSTVVDSSIPTDASLGLLPDVENENGIDYVDRSTPLACLRLIADDTESSTMCHQLTTITSSKAAFDEHDEL